MHVSTTISLLLPHLTPLYQTPSNVPNAPSGVSVATDGDEFYDLLMTWTKPSDFFEWSADGYSIVITLYSFMADVYQHTITNQDVTQYTWPNVAPNRSYSASVHYSNSFGEGPESATSSSMLPTKQPDAPSSLALTEGDQQSVLTWSAPADGQSVLTQYKIYKDGSYLATVTAPTTT